MDDRQRHGRTWPGAAGGGGHRSSTSSQRALPFSRSLPLPNDSIVSLLPSGTEILWALGLGPRCAAIPPPHLCCVSQSLSCPLRYRKGVNIQQKAEVQAVGLGYSFVRISYRFVQDLFHHDDR